MVEAAPATLKISFYSEIPEGRLTVYNGATRLLQESFKFEKKTTGLIRRTTAGPGRAEWSSTLPSGPVKLSIYAKPTGEDTRIKDISGELPAGGEGLLEIRLAADGLVEVSLQ